MCCTLCIEVVGCIREMHRMSYYYYGMEIDDEISY